MDRDERRQPKVAQQFEEFQLMPDVEMVCRLVEHQHWCALHQRASHEDTLALAALSLRGSAFGTRDTDLITSAVIGTYRHPVLGVRPIQQYQNIAKASRPGAEVTAVYANRGTDLAFNYSVIRVTDRTTGNGLYSPPDKAVVTVGHTINRLGARVAWTTTAVRAQGYDATVARRRAGHVVHDLLSTWAPGSGRIRVDAGITNLFDKRYTVYKISGNFTNVPEVGRNATVRATVIW